MRKIRAVVGIVLMVGALAGLVVWEVHGRDALTGRKVLVASADIAEGTEIKEDMLSVKTMQEGMLLKSGFKEAEIEAVSGRLARQYIPKNSQIIKEFLWDDKVILGDKMTVFPIKPEWIESISSSVRRGDKVTFYAGEGREKIGQFVLAFVKDEGEREVKSPIGRNEKNILERTDGDTKIKYVEIIAKIAEYQRISQLAWSGEKFVILQEI